MKQSAINNIVSALGHSQIDPIERPKVVQFVLAKFVAYCLPMPSSPVKSANMHYVEQLRTQANEMIGEFNEVYVVNTKLTERLVQEIWKARYDGIFNVESAQALVVARSIYSDQVVEDGQAKTIHALAPSVDSELTYYLKKGFKSEEE